MRLPNTTYDKNDVFYNLIVGTDVPEKIVEAEDYLMPQSAQAPEEEDAADNNNEDPKVCFLLIIIQFLKFYLESSFITGYNNKKELQLAKWLLLLQMKLASQV